MEKMKLNIQKFASSGTVYTNTADNSKFRVDWQQSGDQDIVNNRTTINWQLWAELGHNYYSNAVKVYGININGQSVYGGGTWSNLNRGNHQLASGSITITHNNDGTKNFNINLSGWTYSSNNYSGSQNFDLNTIPRYATISSAPNFNDEENPTITYSNPLGANATSLQACIADNQGARIYVPYRDISKTGTSYTFELTNEERELFRSVTTTSNTLPIRFYVKTVIGSQILTQYADRTLSIINANPVFSNFEYEDINATTLALTGDNTKNVNGYSTIKATISAANKATAQKSATMSKYMFTIGDKSGDINYSSSQSVNGTIANAPNGVYNVYAIDSRGNTTLVTKMASQTIEYTPISFTTSSCKVERNNGGVGGYAVLTLSGNIWNNSFGQVTNSIKSISYQYKKTTDTQWETGPTTITPTVSDNNFNFTGQIGSNNTGATFELNSSYDFIITITDELSTKSIQLTPMASAVPNISLADEGVGIMCDYDESLGGSLQIAGVKYEEPQKDIFKFQKLQTNATIPSNSLTYFDMGAYTVPTGYKYIGVIAETNGFGDQFLTSYANYSGRIAAMVLSRYSTSLTSTFTCTVLYVKTDYYDDND